MKRFSPEFAVTVLVAMICLASTGCTREDPATPIDKPTPPSTVQQTPIIPAQPIRAETPTTPAAETELDGDTVTGKVVGVTDGDTLTLLVAQTQYKIRLAGIDSPEAGQPFGTQSKKALSDKTFGKTVKVLSTGTDRYGRTLGIVHAGGCINTQLVREGWAWHYKEYSDSKILAEAEEEARNARSGLWVNLDPIPPWEWRRGRPEPLAQSDAANGEASQGNGAVRTPQTAPGQQGDTVYATRTGTKYHRAGCRYLQKSQIPLSLSEAASRYSPCSVCNPPRPKTATAPAPAPRIVPAPRPVAPAATNTHWLTSSSGIRHNSSCRWYRNSNGRPCGPNSGRACKVCGG